MKEKEKEKEKEKKKKKEKDRRSWRRRRRRRRRTGLVNDAPSRHLQYPWEYNDFALNRHNGATTGVQPIKTIAVQRSKHGVHHCQVWW